eukprot:s618_g13.t1
MSAMRTAGLCALIGKVYGAPYAATTSTSSTSSIPPLEDLYLSTLVGTLTGEALRTRSVSFVANEVREYHETAEERAVGKIGCSNCLTMIGSKRLRDVWDVLEAIRVNNVSGDYVQTGVWHGGVAIFARAYFHVYDMDRKVFACDSFEGFPDDDRTAVTKTSYFEVSVDDVAQNFASFALLDDNVVFIKGFFNQTLPDLHDRLRADGRRIALLHLDADLYSSYLDILFNLYDLLEIGSFVICDDCGYIEEAGRAVTDFRMLHGIDALQQLSDSELTRYWQKTAEVEIDWRTYNCWNRSRLSWGLITRCQGSQGIKFEELWQKLGTYVSEMDSTSCSDLQIMMDMTSQHFDSNVLVAEFLNNAAEVLLKDLLDVFHLQERVKQGLILAHTCAEMAMELLHQEETDLAKESQGRAKKWLNAVQEARFRISFLPQWRTTLLV